MYAYVRNVCLCLLPCVFEAVRPMGARVGIGLTVWADSANKRLELGLETVLTPLFWQKLGVLVVKKK